MSRTPGQPRPDAGRSSVDYPTFETLEPRLLLSASLYDTQDVYQPVQSSQTEVLAAASANVVMGIDVSHWQGSINWNTVANNNDIDFVWAKATQGVDFLDDQWYANAAGAHNAGLYIGGYHFATPYTGGVDDAAQEASHFFDVVGSYLTDGFLRPVLDLEGSNSISVTQMSNWVHDFMNTFASLSGGIVPVIYTGSTYATSELNSSVNIYDLWYPRWPTNPDFNNPPSAPGIWDAYDLWQYADDTSVVGFSGNVDGDVFLGDISNFAQKYAISTVPDDHGDDSVSATPVTSPSLTTGELGTIYDEDWFSLTLEAGKTYDFSLLGTTLGDAELSLVNSVGGVYANGTGPASGGILDALSYTPNLTREFYLRVRSTSNGVGTYGLTAQETDDYGDTIAAATDLPIDGSLLGGLQTASDVDMFHFTAEAGKQYDMTVTGLDLSDVTLTLYSDTGVVLDQMVATGGSFPQATLSRLVSSDRELYVSVRSDSGSLGQYGISLSQTEPPLPGDLNGDGYVGLDDLQPILDHWNQSVPPGDASVGDIAGPSGTAPDGYVGLDDLQPVLDNWNTGTLPAVLQQTASQQAVTAAANATQTYGVDVSHYQGSINWSTVANSSNVQFVYAKATEGVNYIDPNWYANVTGANNAGLYVGGYHFATPYTGGVDDAVDEAGDFYNAVKNYLGDGFLRPALDLESGASLSTTVLSNWVHDFMDTFSALSGGIIPIIYTGGYYASSELNSSVNVYDLWYANPTNNPSSPPSPPGVWNSYDLWQYSWTASVSGISGDVDADVFLGDLSQFAAEYAISTVPDDHGDDSAGATPVTSPSLTTGELGTIYDEDWFSLTLEAGKTYDFSLLGTTLGEAELSLVNSVGGVYANGTGPVSGGILDALSYTPNLTREFYLRVHSTTGDVGTYGLTVQETDDYGDTIAEATDLPTAGALFGGLQAASDVDMFHFTAEAGKQYDMTVTGLDLSDVTLTLYNSSGVQLDQMTDTGSNPLATLTWSATTGGELYVSVRSDSGSIGDYGISLSQTDPSLPGDLNGDGYVGLDDLQPILDNWNQNVTVGDASMGDIAGPSGSAPDGYVGLDDLQPVLDNWNTGTLPAATTQSASLQTVTAEVNSTQILGIDVSQYQGTINWSLVASSSDREFAFIRAVDRYGQVDTQFLDNIVNASAAGIYAGAYQFVTPWTDGYNDAVEEAQLFASTIAPYLTEGYLRPVIDIESYSGTHSPDPVDLDNTTLTNWVHDYMDEFVRLTGVEPLIYSNSYYAQSAYDAGVNVYDLWLANWTSSYGQPGDPDSPPSGNADGVWDGYDFWQYSGGGETVAGIAGGVDGDVYFGSVADLLANYGIANAPDDHGGDSTTATAITVPSLTSGAVDTLTDEDWFSLTLEAGTTYDFNLLGLTLGEAELSLVNSAGVAYAIGTGPASGGVLDSLSYTPNLTREFYLRVHSTTGDIGTYGLTAQETDDYGDTIAAATDLPIDGSLLGGLQTASDVDMFHFTAEAGKQYELSVMGLDLPDATLTLCDGSGAQLDQVVGMGGSNPLATLTWSASSGGELYASVHSDLGSLGQYGISLSQTDLSLPGDLNGDGYVGLDDLQPILDHWNQDVTVGDPMQGDVAGPGGTAPDGYVGLDDLQPVLDNWNTGTLPAVLTQSALSAPARSAFIHDSVSLQTPALGLWDEDLNA